MDSCGCNGWAFCTEYFNWSSGVKSLRKATDLILDTHLMIENPEKYVEPFAKAGSDILTFHYEACKNISHAEDVISMIKSFGKKVGISIKPKTEPKEIFPLLSEVDLVLVMTVNRGLADKNLCTIVQ